MEEHRTYPRFTQNNMIVDISDGHGFFTGFVGNISKAGLFIKQIPTTLDDEYKRLTVIVAKKEANFRLIIRPQWVQEEGFTKDIGARIVESSDTWKKYIDSLM